MNKFYTGCVEDRNDPLKLGRCQVRIVGLHTEDKTILPTADLPWAFPVTPITSAGVSGIGSAPLGPVEGSWVLIMFMDADQQLPIMMGTLGGISQIANAKDDSKTIQVNSVSPDGTVNQSPGDPEATGAKQPTNLQDGTISKPDEIVGPLGKLIASGESGSAGYDAFNRGSGAPKGTGSTGGQKLSLTDMTIKEIMDKQSLQPGDPNRLFAVGKYQIIPSTMLSLVKKLKLDPDETRLDPETQDALFANGLVGIVRKKVDDYIKGLSDDKNAAILELAKEFASVGIPYDMKVGKKELKKGDSYYSGQGGNKAHNSPEEVGAALDADRMKKLGTTKPALAENVSKYETGEKVAAVSVTNKDLKTTQGTKTIIDNTTTVASAGTVNKQYMQTPAKDIPPTYARQS